MRHFRHPWVHLLDPSGVLSCRPWAPLTSPPLRHRALWCESFTHLYAPPAPTRSPLPPPLAPQIWHRSNWHWYMKQERRYAAAAPGGGGGGGGVLVRWDDQSPSTLHVISGGGGGVTYERLGMAWHMCVSDFGTAAVVDGESLLLTPLRCGGGEGGGGRAWEEMGGGGGGGELGLRLVDSFSRPSPYPPPSLRPSRHICVPPPMCAVRLRLPAPAVAVALSGSGGVSAGGAGGEAIAAALSDGRLAFACSVEDDLWEETLEVRDPSPSCPSPPRPAPACLNAALPPPLRMRCSGAGPGLGPPRGLGSGACRRGRALGPPGGALAPVRPRALLARRRHAAGPGFARCHPPL